MSKIDLNILRERAYKIACDHGFKKGHYWQLYRSDTKKAAT